MPQIHALIPAGDTLRTYRLAVATTGEYYIGRDMGLSIAGAERREEISLVVDDLKRRFREASCLREVETSVRDSPTR